MGSEVQRGAHRPPKSPSWWGTSLDPPLPALPSPPTRLPRVLQGMFGCQPQTHDKHGLRHTTGYTNAEHEAQPGGQAGPHLPVPTPGLYTREALRSNKHPTLGARVPGVRPQRLLQANLLTISAAHFHCRGGYGSWHMVSTRRYHADVELMSHGSSHSLQWRDMQRSGGSGQTQSRSLPGDSGPSLLSRKSQKCWGRDRTLVLSAQRKS